MAYAQSVLRFIRQDEIRAWIFERAFKLFRSSGSQLFAAVKPTPEDDPGRYFQVSVPFHALPASLARILELHRRNPRLDHRAIKETRARFLSRRSNNIPAALHSSTIQTTFLLFVAQPSFVSINASLIFIPLESATFQLANKRQYFRPIRSNYDHLRNIAW